MNRIFLMDVFRYLKLYSLVHHFSLYTSLLSVPTNRYNNGIKSITIDFCVCHINVRSLGTNYASYIFAVLKL